MKKPNLFIVGAPRCGTTSIYMYLKEHPDIFMSPVKEIHYFGQDVAKLLRVPGEYLSRFSGWKDEKCAGEASVFYLYSETAARELKAFNPSARIIIMLRNPVDFLYSYHTRIRTFSVENIKDFETALNAEPDRRQGKRLPKLVRKHGSESLLFYRKIATFSEQVQRYLDAYGSNQVKVILLDDLKADPAKVYRDTLRFLEVDPDFETDFSEKNTNRYPRSILLMRFLLYSLRFAGGKSLPSRAYRKLIFHPLRRWNMQITKRKPMSPSLRRKLQSEFAPEVQKLGEILGRDLRYWSD
jgi:hypothetical protein